MLVVIRSATATPSSSALWASIGPRTTSPTAGHIGQVRAAVVVDRDEAALVDSASPTASGFSPVVFGTRPIDTISLSTANVCASPFASV